MNESPGSRRTKRLLIAAAACFVGIPVFVILHNVFDALSGITIDIVIVSWPLGVLSAASFLAALFVCPAGFVIFLVAAVVEPLTRGWGTATRRILLVVVPVVLAIVAVVYFLDFLSISVREQDDTAGFNGSFEVVGSRYPVNWYFYKRALDDGDAVVAVDTAEPIDGAQSLKMVVYRADPDDGKRDAGLFQVRDAQAGQTFRVSFWVKNQGCRFRVRIDSDTPESRQPRNPIRETIDAETTGDGVWSQFVYTYTVPQHYSNVRFELNVVAPGTLWLDDVRIEPLPEG